MTRIAILIVVLVGVFLVFQRHETAPDDPWDTAVLAYIALVQGLGAIVMLLSRYLREWSARAAGIFGVMAATAQLYGALVFGRLGGGMAEWWTDSIRAQYVVFGTLFLWGVYHWAREFRRRFRRWPKRAEMAKAMTGATVEEARHEATTMGGDRPAWNRTVPPIAEGK